jgi:hypothetical protein
MMPQQNIPDDSPLYNSTKINPLARNRNNTLQMTPYYINVPKIIQVHGAAKINYRRPPYRKVPKLIIAHEAASIHSR